MIVEWKENAFGVSNGKSVSMLIGTTCHGSYAITPDGYVPFNHRKPLATEAEARKKVLIRFISIQQRLINVAQKEMARLDKLAKDHPIPPSDRTARQERDGLSKREIKADREP